ncbi:MAG: prepilin-type N-terminal cleavage/methylation domain-containing protein [Phycisphaeraceae bacterium]|nr:prepilin-type N-terminal cleavage/methylation domain-containing protein [Phycisphaeraceae bacterium]
MPARRPARSRRTAFTLTEILVVVALIAVLVAILLTALGKVRTKARESSSESTMQAFANACELFQQDHRTYPGAVPERVLASAANANVNITSTQAALLQLLGGYIRESDGAEYGQAPYTTWPELAITDAESPGGFFRMRYSLQRIGDGPRINGTSYRPYFSASERNFGVATQFGPLGAVGALPTGDQLPDLLDAFDNPIIYYRRQRPEGALTGNDNSVQYRRLSNRAYLQPQGADGPGSSLQARRSILSEVNEYGGDIQTADRSLAMLLRHPSIPDVARGGYAVFSAGVDQIFFAATDGPGTRNDPVWDLQAAGLVESLRGVDLIREYNDLAVYGGQ